MQQAIESESAGVVGRIDVSVGDAIEVGDVLLLLESMKVQIPVESTVAGRIAEILVALDDTVDEGQVVVIVDR